MPGHWASRILYYSSASPYLNFNMPSALRRKGGMDYKELNFFSSEVLFDTSRKPKGKFFSVDKIIERRKSTHVSFLYEFCSMTTISQCSSDQSDVQ